MHFWYFARMVFTSKEWFAYKGLIVSNSFRSIEGIKGRLRSMGAAYDERLLPDCDIPQVFSDAVTLYRERPMEFKKVLRVALKYATPLKSSNRYLFWSKQNGRNLLCTLTIGLRTAEYSNLI